MQESWCRGYRIEDGRRLGALTPRPFCGDCEKHITACLGELPGWYVRLAGELGAKEQAGERVSGSREAPVPPRLDVDALMWDMWRTLGAWDRRVRAAAGMTGQPAARRHGPAVWGRRGFVAVLGGRMTTLLGLPAETMRVHVRPRDAQPGATGVMHVGGDWAEEDQDLSGVDAGRDIMRLRGRARAILGEFKETEPMGAPCPRCDRLELVKVAGEDLLLCKGCGHRPQERYYESWVRLLAGGAWYYHHMSVKLAPLLGLPYGWDGYRGRPVSGAASGGVHAVVQAVMRPEFAPPQYFPLPGGGVQLEWRAGGDEIVIEVDPGGSAWVLAVTADGVTVAEGELGPGLESVAAVRDLLGVMSVRIFDVMGVRAFQRAGT